MILVLKFLAFLLVENKIWTEIEPVTLVKALKWELWAWPYWRSSSTLKLWRKSCSAQFYGVSVNICSTTRSFYSVKIRSIDCYLLIYIAALYLHQKLGRQCCLSSFVGFGILRSRLHGLYTQFCKVLALLVKVVRFLFDIAEVGFNFLGAQACFFLAPSWTVTIVVAKLNDIPQSFWLASSQVHPLSIRR